MDSVVIAEPARRDMPAGAALLGSSLGFAGDDAIPAWLMAATGAAGGLVLAAYDGEALVGWSYAFAGWDGGESYLSSCGLAVAASHRGRGVGRRLKLAQRDRARERGYRSIRWTADPLAAPALRLYLSGLGARLTRYHAGLFEGLRASTGIPQDDVDIVWPLGGEATRTSTTAEGGARRVAAATRAPTTPGELRAGVAAPSTAERVEIPADRSALAPDAHLAWRLAVRERFSALLDAGYAGTAVDRDAVSGRCWVVFTPAAR